MSGGFENSSLKNSFSLSSLPPSTHSVETPEHARLQERPYNSLTKKPRRDLEQESWRRSWGKDESRLSASFDINYQYLMDSKLIESCKEELQDPLALALSAEEWTVDQFYESFNQLDSWLDSFLDSFSNHSPADVISRDFYSNQYDAFKYKGGKVTEFNDQGERLVKTCPDLQDEILQRVALINKKWDQVKEAVAIRYLEDRSPKDAESEFKALRNWIKEMDERLTRIKINKMDLQELDELASELKKVRSSDTPIHVNYGDCHQARWQLFV